MNVCVSYFFVRLLGSGNVFATAAAQKFKILTCVVWFWIDEIDKFNAET